MFTHYLITRFNIKVSGAGPEVLNSAGANEEWFQTRMMLFKSFCAPSVLGQISKNFKWLIYFDPSTSLEEIAYMLHSRVPVEFILTKDYHSMVQDIIHRIREAPTPYVITSRMDNDDAISSIFIQSIQQAFIPVDKTIINANSGYVYDSAHRLLTRWNKRYKNQFLSIIEDKNADRLYTVYGFPHWKPPAEVSIINIQGPPYWIYWRHSDNFSDQQRTGIPMFTKNRLNTYPQAVQRIPISWKSTIAYAIQWLPKVIGRRLKNIFRSGERKD